MGVESISTFDGDTLLASDWLEDYIQCMDFLPAAEQLAFFKLKLKGAALQWVHALTPTQQPNFATLVEAFKHDFVTKPTAEHKRREKKLAQKEKKAAASTLAPIPAPAMAIFPMLRCDDTHGEEPLAWFRTFEAAFPHDWNDTARFERFCLQCAAGSPVDWWVQTLPTEQTDTWSNFDAAFTSHWTTPMRTILSPARHISLELTPAHTPSSDQHANAPANTRTLVSPPSLLPLHSRPFVSACTVPTAPTNSHTRPPATTSQQPATPTQSQPAAAQSANAQHTPANAVMAQTNTEDTGDQEEGRDGVEEEWKERNGMEKENETGQETEERKGGDRVQDEE